jgi:hypothetical protein
VALSAGSMVTGYTIEGVLGQGGSVSLVVLCGKSLRHTAIGAIYGGGGTVGRLAGPNAPRAIPRLRGVIAAGGHRRRAGAGGVPRVWVPRAGRAVLCIPVWGHVTGVNFAVRWWRVGERFERGKREGLLRRATNDTAFGKPTDPPHRSNVSVRQRCGTHGFGVRGAHAELSPTWRR